MGALLLMLLLLLLVFNTESNLSDHHPKNFILQIKNL